MDHTLTLDEKLAMRGQLDREARTEASRTVAFLLRLFNAHEPLPETVSHKETTVLTGRFLRGIGLDPVTRELPASHLFQRGLGENATDLAAQALDLADAAEREGLLDMATDAADAIPAEMRRLLARGNNKPSVTVEPRSGPLSAEQEAEVAATVAGNAEARRLYQESTGRRAFAPPVEPQPATSGGRFDRASFRDQTAS